MDWWVIRGFDGICFDLDVVLWPAAVETILGEYGVWDRGRKSYLRRPVGLEMKDFLIYGAKGVNHSCKA